MLRVCLKWFISSVYQHSIAYYNELLDRLKVIVEVLVDSQQHFVDNIDKIKEVRLN